MRKEWELFTNSLLFRHINLPLLSMFYLQKYFNIFNARINASTPNIPVVFLSLFFFFRIESSQRFANYVRIVSH